MLEYIWPERPLFSGEHAEDLWRRLERILDEDEFVVLRTSISQLLLRVLELTLLSDDALLEIALYPDSYAGVAEQMIRDRLTALFPGEEIPGEAIQHIRSCLLSRGSLNTNKHRFAKPEVADVMAKAVRETGDRRLRCRICGYHFRSSDLGAERLAVADELDIEFARTLLPRRVRDRWKTARREDTGFSLDHIVPEAGLGWSSLDNLQILCGFCNGAKQIYRWGGERISTANAASLMTLLGGKRGAWAIRGALFSAMAERVGCQTCSKDSKEIELTCRHRSGVQGIESMAPWRLEVVCYDCFDPSDEQ